MMIQRTGVSGPVTTVCSVSTRTRSINSGHYKCRAWSKAQLMSRNIQLIVINDIVRVKDAIGAYRDLTDPGVNQDKELGRTRHV